MGRLTSELTTPTKEEENEMRKQVVICIQLLPNLRSLELPPETRVSSLFCPSSLFLLYYVMRRYRRKQLVFNLFSQLWRWMLQSGSETRLTFV